MPADFISRVIDHTDPNAADLEDDSKLVFPITDTEKLQSSQIVGPKPIRSYNGDSSKPYRTDISLLFVKHDQDLTVRCCDSSAAHSRMQTLTEPR